MPNRQIKFRAWLTEKRRMVDVQIYDSKTNVIVPMDENIGIMNEFRLMQFTGLTDINGTKIYEGDLIKDREGEIRIVEWCDDEACFKGRDVYNISGKIAECIYGEDIRDNTVIGNEFENLELLIPQK